MDIIEFNYRKPSEFKVGDRVIDKVGRLGTITDIGLRSIVVKVMIDQVGYAFYSPVNLTKISIPKLYELARSWN